MQLEAPSERPMTSKTKATLLFHSTLGVPLFVCCIPAILNGSIADVKQAGWSSIIFSIGTAGMVLGAINLLIAPATAGFLLAQGGFPRFKYKGIRSIVITSCGTGIVFGLMVYFAVLLFPKNPTPTHLTHAQSIADALHWLPIVVLGEIGVAFVVAKVCVYISLISGLVQRSGALNNSVDNPHAD